MSTFSCVSNIDLSTDYIAELKRKALIYDRIYIYDLTQALTGVPDSDTLHAPSSNPKSKLLSFTEFKKELHRLKDIGILHEAGFNGSAGVRKALQVDPTILYEAMPFLARGTVDHSKMSSNELEFLVSLGMRVASIVLNKDPNNDCEAYPELVHQQFSPLLNKPKKHSVLQVVVNQIPLVDDSVSWDRIIEYKSDSSSRGQIAGLKCWINDMARSDLPPSEVADKLDYIISEYEKHLKLFELKTVKGRLETIVVTVAEIVENLIKFKWGGLAKNMFSLRDREIQLLEAELSMPHREVAYLVDSKKLTQNT